MEFFNIGNVTFGVQAFSVEWGFNIIWYSHKNGSIENASYSFYFRVNDGTISNHTIQTNEWLNLKRFIEANMAKIQKQLLKLFK